jgi:hemoglobin/transferrin/lactoferrin receptor protein
MLAKGSWKIDTAQTLSGSLRYYNNARRNQNPQTSAADTSNPMTNRSTIQRDAQLATALPRKTMTGRTPCIYWSEARINAQNAMARANSASKPPKAARLKTAPVCFRLFASHLLTYGGEYYRQEQQPGG